MTRLSATAIRDLASTRDLPDYLGEEIAASLTEGDGFADEHLVLFALDVADAELRDFR